MSLRELLLFGALAALIVIVPRRPVIGAYAWVVFGVMNPHRLAWGAAYDFPFSQAIAILTLVGLLLTKEHRHWKGGGAIVVLLVFFAWTGLTTLFAFDSASAIAYWQTVLKNYLMTIVLMTLVHTRKQVIILVSVLAFSLGFYGVKGGLFVLATGGQYMVNGPPDGPMHGNNSLGVGLTVVLALMYFLLQQSRHWLLRWGMTLSMAMCSVAILGTYSRGAMLAIAAAGALLWLRGRHKFIMMIGILAFALAAIPAMPEAWVNKISTLKTYEEDGSAMGRLIAWETAYNIAVDKFPLAGGFSWDSRETSRRYSPDPNVVLVPHSIYFQVLGTQGFIGLSLYLLFWMLVWSQANWLRKHGALRPDLEWARSLGSMMQVALIGYFVGGAFLDLAFWELAYYLFAVVATAKYVVRKALSAGGAVGSRQSPGIVPTAPGQGPTQGHPASNRPAPVVPDRPRPALRRPP